MTPEQLLATVQAAGIVLWLDASALRYRAPKGALTDDLRQAIREQKRALLAVLTPSTQQARPAPLDPDYPCVMCSCTERWNDRGIWRCHQCWPPGSLTARQPVSLAQAGRRGRVQLM
jgi:hypothetical protein